MPNWVTNTLHISVPEEYRTALRDALAGPPDWPMPLDACDPRSD